MRICCTMIVKDEAHVIQRCLESVLPLVDCVCICDTGSTDDTHGAVCKAIGQHLAQIDDYKPGSYQSVYRVHEWHNFGANRTMAFREAEAAFGLTADDWHLVIDADDVLTFTSDNTAAAVRDRMRNLVCSMGDPVVYPEMASDYNILRREVGLPEFVTSESWWLQVDYNGTTYHRPHLFRADGLWEYRGPIHEAAYRQEGQPEPIKGYLPGLQIKVIGGGARSQVSQEAKFSQDAALLEAHLAEHPDDARQWFYYAQSLRDAGRIPEAIEAYRKRATMGGWAQERYCSLLQAGRLCRLLGQHGGNDLIFAHLEDTTRAEAPFEIAKQLLERPLGTSPIVRWSQDLAVYHWAEIAATRPAPAKGVLFAEPNVWDMSKAMAEEMKARLSSPMPREF